MARERGISDKVFTIIKAGHGRWLHKSELYAALPDIDPDKIKCALSYLSINYPDDIQREGSHASAKYRYIGAEVPDATVSDVLEDLLTAMARAEPVLRRLSEARRLLAEV